MQHQHALHSYQQIQTDSARDATPHQLITKLFDSLLQRLASSRGHIQRKEVAEKGQCLGKAVSIIGGLRGSLNHEAGGELATNLDNLYEYCERRLLDANHHNNLAAIDEVVGLLKDIRNAWVEIPPTNHQPLGSATPAPALAAAGR